MQRVQAQRTAVKRMMVQRMVVLNVGKSDSAFTGVISPYNHFRRHRTDKKGKCLMNPSKMLMGTYKTDAASDQMGLAAKRVITLY